MFSPRDLSVAKLELARHTKMVDYTISLYETTHDGDAPQELRNQREQIMSQYEQARESAKKILDLIDPMEEGVPSEEGRAIIEAGNFTRSYLEAEVGVQQEDIDAFYRCAKFMFDCGGDYYDTVAKYLYYYLQLVEGDEAATLCAQWGKFACEMLSDEWAEANNDREKLQELLSTMKVDSQLRLLEQRTWLLHWSLFVFFNVDRGHELLVETFTDKDNMNAIQINCPWLLRYLGVVMVLQPRFHHLIPKYLLRAYEQEKRQFTDPVLDFLELLYVEFDFDGAQKKLRECLDMLAADFFLSQFSDESAMRETFLEQARQMIFEVKCRIHQEVDTEQLASKLGLAEQEAEKWVVELVRSAHLEARIDTAQRRVLMRVQYPDVYQQVIDKTKDLTMRTQLLAGSLPGAAGGGGRGGRESRSGTGRRG